MVRTTLIVLASLCLTGCIIVADVDADWDWDGNWVKRDQNVTDVTEVEFSARGTLYITQGRRSELRLEGHEEALEQLRIEERNGTLIIAQASDKQRWYSHGGKGNEPVYSLEIKDLESIRHTGHGTLRVGPFTLKELSVDTAEHAQTHIASINARAVEVSTSDHGRVRIETLDADELAIQTADHSDVYLQDGNVLDVALQSEDHGEIWLSGKADSMHLLARDHSDVDAVDFEVAVATVTASDNAKAQLSVNEELSLDQRDRAQVDVKGDPQEVSDED